MAGYNKVVLLGNLTRDPEKKTTSGDTSVTNFGMAMNRKYGSGENSKEEVTFVECTAWSKQADLIAQHVKKGDPLLIDGRLSLDQWNDKDGNKRSRVFVTVENFQFMPNGKGKNSEGGSGGGNSSPAAPAGLDPIGDDIPI